MLEPFEPLELFPVPPFPVEWIRHWARYDKKLTVSQRLRLKPETSYLCTTSWSHPCPWTILFHPCPWTILFHLCPCTWRLFLLLYPCKSILCRLFLTNVRECEYPPQTRHPLIYVGALVFSPLYDIMDIELPLPLEEEPVPLPLEEEPDPMVKSKRESRLESQTFHPSSQLPSKQTYLWNPCSWSCL